MKALDTRTAWRIAFSAWRYARRDLTAPGAIGTANEMASLMRKLSGNWDLPHPVARFSGQIEKIVGGCYRWRGPYRSGREFLRRLNEAERTRAAAPRPTLAVMRATIDERTSQRDQLAEALTQAATDFQLLQLTLKAAGKDGDARFAEACARRCRRLAFIHLV